MKFGINKKVTFMGTIILVLFLVLMLFSNKVINQLSNDIELSKDLSQLKQLTELMTKSSSDYQKNAPRDYESYNRDLKVFYTSLQDNLGQLDALIEKTSHHYFNRNATAGFLINTKIINNNDEAFKKVIELKTVFDKGFKEKIGDNEEEPRLEWANDYISLDTSGLFAHINVVTEHFQELLTAHQQATIRFNNLISLTIAIVFIALIIWINQTIVKRILTVAKACKEVSLGNYGLQVKDKHSDEIGVLVKDFNQLSSRLKSVLSILNELNSTNNDQQALNVIKKETQTLIDASSLYFLTPSTKGYSIKSIASGNSQQNIANKEIIAEDSCLSWVGSEKDYLLINDILSHTMSQNNSHMAKHLLHSINANSLLVLKINDKNHNGLLLIAKSEKNGFTQQQAETLNSLSTLFGKALLT
ncbi:MAG: HAMP domain-containing protein [Marinicellaceae bacterium]